MASSLICVGQHCFSEALMLIGIVMVVGIGCVSLGLNKLALLNFIGLKLAKSAIWPAMKPQGSVYRQHLRACLGCARYVKSLWRCVRRTGALADCPTCRAWPGMVVAGGCVPTAIALRVQTMRDQSQASESRDRFMMGPLQTERSKDRSTEGPLMCGTRCSCMVEMPSCC